MKQSHILAVGASPRNGGNTDHLLAAAAQGAREAGALVELVQLRDMVVNPCLGCEACRDKKACVTIKDDMQDLYPVIEKAGGLLLASPTHNYNITAWMKAFIDRLYCYYDFTNDHPRKYSSRLANRPRRAALMAVCEQTDPEEMGFTLPAMGRPLIALGYDIVGELPVYGIFEAGLVARNESVMKAAAQLGQVLAEKTRHP